MIDLATLTPGTEIPTMSRRGTFVTWSHFAAVNYEIAEHHMDDEVARHEGFPGAFAMAPLTLSYMQTVLRDWLGDHGRLVSVSIQLRSPFLRNRVLTAHGRVTAVHPGATTTVELEVWADDDLGTLVTKGTAVVALFTA